MLKVDNKMFIKKANKIYGDKYDYSLVEYLDAKTKVKIICRDHGVFERTPSRFFSGRECPKCNKDNNKNYYKKEFIKKSKIIHNNKYDYSLVEYITNNITVKIICPVHGIFEQVPMNHIKGNGCSKCSGNKTLTTIEFIKKSNKIHNNNYDYSLSEYVRSYKKVKIICPIHGIFEQQPNNHLNGQGCPKCKGGVSKDKNYFINKSKETHSKYDYSLVEYVNMRTDVKIICPFHGVFEQRPSHHIGGVGCPFCNESKGEREIEKFLLDEEIEYTRQKKFNGCKNKRKLPFDFYLPEYNMCIEFDGRQHFISIDYFGGDEHLEYVKINDSIKTTFCVKNNIRLLRIRHDENILEKLINNIEI